MPRDTGSLARPAGGTRGLADLTPTTRQPAACVAFGRRGVRSWADFVGHVDALAAAVRRGGAGRWLVLVDDAYTQAVALLALARARGCAVLPPNAHDGTLRPLAASAAGVIAEAVLPAGAGADLPRLDPLGQPAVAAAPWTPLDREAPLAEFYTSGTTGAGKAVPKAVRHLDDEVATLESELGRHLGATTPIFATVSHQHIYGLLFRVLWPLACGRPFSTDTFLHLEELVPRMAEAGEGALVTTPVVLRRAAARASLAPLRPACRATFSSGAPLDDTTARATAAMLGAPPLEVLGSTETGGVAWRAQRGDPEAALWTPFRAVHVEREPAEGRLVVTSPLASVGAAVAPGHRRFAMGDRIALADGGRFRIVGRADRVVKIGGKRLDLPEMEARLRDHPAVADTALVPIGPSQAPRVHAAVALSAEGRAALAAGGRATMARALTAHLGSFFDRVLLPRAWRYVDALPSDPQGKTSAAAVRALFAPGDGVPAPPPDDTDEPSVAPPAVEDRPR